MIRLEIPKGSGAHRRAAFTIVEILVSVAIIAVLAGLLLPAVGKARDQARLTMSKSNLRDLAMAHAAYSAEWGDRQFTLIDGHIANYAETPADALDVYTARHGGYDHAPVRLGWATHPSDGYGSWIYPINRTYFGNLAMIEPISFRKTDGKFNYFGSFRLHNVRQFNQYVSGRFYDRTFYAPKDRVVMEVIADAFEDPGEFSYAVEVEAGEHEVPAWSSYCLSPAAMFNPHVMRHDDPDDSTANGWIDPWELPAGFRSPGVSQASFPSLKTRMIEHHWLQNTQSAECNPLFDPGTYAGCEPFYFNHGAQSSPSASFFDGHVGSIGVEQAVRMDARVREQTHNDNWGLWSRDTAFGEYGYLSDYSYEIQKGFPPAVTSFHILTTDGIRGRDRLDGDE
jgi:type II secretory pathway pseudopilin PulG